MIRTIKTSKVSLALALATAVALTPAGVSNAQVPLKPGLPKVRHMLPFQRDLLEKHHFVLMDDQATLDTMFREAQDMMILYLDMEPVLSPPPPSSESTASVIYHVNTYGVPSFTPAEIPLVVAACNLNIQLTFEMFFYTGNPIFFDYADTIQTVMDSLGGGPY